jgi:ketosteroid isomerase-like protein
MDPKELIERGKDAWHARDQKGFFDTYTEDCELNAPGFTGKGRQGLQEFWSFWMDGFPDNKTRAHLLIADGNNVAEESEFEGTNSGPLQGPDGTQTPATGRPFSAQFSGIHTVRDGKLASTRFYFDQLDMLTQLGLTPS